MRQSLKAVRLMLLMIMPVTGAEALAAQDFNLDREHVEDELIVKFKAGVASAQTEKIVARYGAKVLYAFKNGALHLGLPTRGDESALKTAAARLASEPEIGYVEGNSIFRAAVMPKTLGPIVVDRSGSRLDAPNDPDFGKLYGLHNSGDNGGAAGADIKALDAWGISTGSQSVLVGVIDTGIDYTHPDLALNYWTNPGETGLDANGNDKATNGVDDDGNGYVDDFRGWNFVANTNDPMDDNEHGTHVAGTIGARGNDGVGIVGVNWRVSLVAIKFLADDGSGTLVNAVKSVEYATALGVTITNNSWGSTAGSETLAAAIAAANDKGILFVAAAGNVLGGNDNDVSPYFPASFDLPNIISVAATDRADVLAEFSCWGKKSVDIAAPGVDIYSSVPLAKYAVLSGTSMASPHVAGVAALVKARFPDATAAEIKAHILNSVDPLPAVTGKTTSGGRLNAKGALEADTVAPNAPSNLTVGAATVTAFDLVFDAAGDDGAAGLAKRYDIRVAATPIDSEAAWLAAATADADVSNVMLPIVHATVRNLPFNAEGFVAAKAIDNVGNVGPLSATVPFTLKPVVKIFEAHGDSMDGVTADAPWAVEADTGAGGSVFSDSPGGPYANNAATSLQLPPIETSSADVTLAVRMSWELESNFDFGYVEASKDGGITWAVVEKLTGASGGDVDRRYNLTAALGGIADGAAALIRFRLVSDYSVVKDGWKIDDVAIYGSRD